MKIGIFDHLDGADVPLAQFFDDRLRLVEEYDRQGFYAYHVAEHHFTPLGMSPSPSVYLSAVAQRTKHIRFGSLVYILPLYHPLRLAEEICMLDQMSHGRFQVGVGRGISPIEVGFMGLEVAQSQAMYLESFQVILKALTQAQVNHEGQYYRFSKVPMVLKPLQQPHPPLWYGVGQIEGVDWCVENRVNAVVNGSFERVRQITDRFRARWAETGLPAADRTLMGTGRHVVVAGSDAQAQAIAARAYAKWHHRFMLLWREHGMSPMFAQMPEDFKVAVDMGIVVAGSATTVRETLLDHVRRTGVNYLLTRFAFGDLSLQESLESVERFCADIMPSIAALELP